jgi:HEAT repeat protein
MNHEQHEEHETIEIGVFMAFRSVFAVLTAVVGVLLLGGCAQAKLERTGLEKAITYLQMQARSTDQAVRANCIEALQMSKDRRAEEVIEQGLHDKEWVVRFSACMAIGKRQTASYKPVLERLAKDDPDDSVKVAAVYALRRIGSTANMDLLASTLRSPNPVVRANTALVLGLMGDATAIPLLKSIRSEPEPAVKFEIAAALARLGDQAGQRVVIAQALSSYAEDQWVAMQVCADLPPAVGAKPLLMGLHYPVSMPTDVQEYIVRRQLVAARSLGRMRSAEGADIAAGHLKDSQPGLRALAALALGDILVPRDDEVVVKLMTELERMIGDANPLVARSAAAALVNIWSRKA